MNSTGIYTGTPRPRHSSRFGERAMNKVRLRLPLRSFYQRGMGGSIRWLNRATFQEIRKGLFVSAEKNEGRDGDTECRGHGCDSKLDV